MADFEVSVRLRVRAENRNRLEDVLVNLGDEAAYHGVTSWKYDLSEAAEVSEDPEDVADPH